MGIFSFLFRRGGEEPKAIQPTVAARPILKLQGTVGAEGILEVGTQGMLESKSPKGRFAVVFEDDGQTGYFYALDTTREDQPIIDTVHIYNVENVLDREKPSKFTILWSPDAMKVGLFINNYPQAVFDLAAERVYCRTKYPETDKEWSKHSREWSDSALKLFT